MNSFSQSLIPSDSNSSVNIIGNNNNNINNCCNELNIKNKNKRQFCSEINDNNNSSVDHGTIIVSLLNTFQTIKQHFNNPLQPISISPQTREIIGLLLQSTVQTMKDMMQFVQTTINNSAMNHDSFSNNNHNNNGSTVQSKTKLLRFIEPKIHCDRINNSNKYDLVFDWSHKLIIDENIPFKGRGLRAAVRIPAHSAIRYYGEKINRQTMIERRSVGKSNYILKVTNDHFIDSHPDLDLPKNMCIAGLINEPSIGERVNCRLISRRDYIVIAVDIEAGEELLMSYGVLGCSRGYNVGNLKLPTIQYKQNNNKKQRINK